MELSTFRISPCCAEIEKESRMDVCAHISKRATADINILNNRPGLLESWLALTKG